MTRSVFKIAVLSVTTVLCLTVSCTQNSNHVSPAVSSASAAPIIYAQPTAEVGVLEPSPAMFNVAAASPAILSAPTYQWQVSTDGEARWTNIAGATRASYAMPSTSTADDGHVFRCVVTNEAGSITSDASKLSVNIITEEEKAKLEAMKPEVDKILEAVLGSSSPQNLSENAVSTDKIDGINNQVSDLLKGQFGDGYKKFYSTMPLSISSSKDNVGNVSEKSLSKVNGISTPYIVSSSASSVGTYSGVFYYFDAAFPDSSGGVKHRLVQYVLNCSFQLNACPWFAYHTASQNVVLYIVEYYVSSSGVPSLISNTVDTAWAPYLSSLGLCDEVQQSSKQLNWCPGAKITVMGSLKVGWFPQMWGGVTYHWFQPSMYDYYATLDRTILWCGVTPSVK